MRSLLILALVAGLALPAMAQPEPASVVFFAEWSAAIDAPARAVISAAAASAKRAPDAKVIVVGTADPTGSARANALVSALRAQQVADALAAAGVAPGRIEQHAAGEVGYALSAQESRRVTITVGAK